MPRYLLYILPLFFLPTLTLAALTPAQHLRCSITPIFFFLSEPDYCIQEPEVVTEIVEVPVAVSNSNYTETNTSSSFSNPTSVSNYVTQEQLASALSNINQSVNRPIYSSPSIFNSTTTYVTNNEYITEVRSGGSTSGLASSLSRTTDTLEDNLSILQSDLATLSSSHEALSASFMGTGQWMVNGDDVYRLTGKVGIGTANPSGKFEVGTYGGGVTTGDFVVDSDDKTVYVGRLSTVSGDNSNFVVRNRLGAETFKINQLNSKAHFLIPLGLGTSTPANTSSLHVYSSQARPQIIERSTTGNVSTEYKNTLGSMFVGLVGGTSNFGISTTINIDTGVMTTFTQEGKVGIGTTTPLGKLDIQLGTGNSYARFSGGVAGSTSGGLELGGYFSQSVGNTWGMYTNNSGQFSFKNSNSSATIDLSISGGAIVINSDQFSAKSNGYVYAPAFRFGTTQTGLYAPAANVIGFVNNGSETMRILTDGKVGIGTTSPTAMLAIQTSASNVSGLVIKDSSSQSAPGLQLIRSDNLKMVELKRGAGTAAGQLSLYDTAGAETKAYGDAGTFVIDSGATAKLRLVPSGNNVYFQNTNTSGDMYFTGNSAADLTGQLLFRNTGNVRFGTSGSERMSILTNGNVGIGIISPDYKLDVEGTIGFGPTSYKNTLSMVTANDAVIEKHLHTGYGLWVRSSDGARSQGMDVSGVGGSTLGIFTNGSERITVNASGNVGIGTTTPANKLHVLDLTAITDNTSRDILTVGGYLASGLNSRAAITFTNRWDTANYFTSARVSSGIHSGSWGGKLYFETSNPSGQSTLPTVKMTVDGVGNVGIGTTTPSAKLTVVGAGLFTGGISSPGAGISSEVFGSSASAAGIGSTAVGQSTNSHGLYATSLGYLSSAGAAAVALGMQSSAQGSNSVSLGQNSAAAGTFAMAFGSQSSASHAGSIAMGVNTLTTAANQLVIGSPTAGYSVNEVYIGGGVTNAAPVNLTLNSTGGSGSNIAGANLTLAGGKGTGNAAGGALIFSTSNPGSSGATLQSLTEKMRITIAGNIGIGTTTPSSQLTTTGSVRFANFGAGTLQTDADGNLSVSSDENLKDIEGTYEAGLKEVMGINPITFKWNEDSGLETNGTYVGFSAQNVKEFLPDAVGEDKKGFLTLSDRGILAALVNAVKEAGGYFKDGVLSIKEAVIDTITADTVRVRKGIEMESENGVIYCVIINNRGDFVKRQGTCDDVDGTLLHEEEESEPEFEPEPEPEGEPESEPDVQPETVEGSVVEEEPETTVVQPEPVEEPVVAEEPVVDEEPEETLQ